MLEELSTTVSRMLDSKLVGNISSDVYGGEGVPHDNSTWPGCRAHDCPMGRAVNDAMLASCRLQLGYVQEDSAPTTCAVAASLVYSGHVGVGVGPHLGGDGRCAALSHHAVPTRLDQGKRLNGFWYGCLASGDSRSVGGGDATL